MNILDYRRLDENGLSFVLLVDGEALGTLVGARDTAIPYWLIEDDLPGDSSEEPEIRIVAVCSCGDSGCGHTQCRIVHEQDSVVFCDFDLDVNREGRNKEFRFSRTNYDSVVSAIVHAAKEHRATAD